MSYTEEFRLINNETGEIEVKNSKQRLVNKPGFVLIYREALQILASEAPSLSVMKVFSLLSSLQEYADDGINITKQAIADTIGTTYKSVWSACKWLEENKFIKTRKHNGQTQFLLNPDITTCGRKRQAKKMLWAIN